MAVMGKSTEEWYQTRCNIPHMYYQVYLWQCPFSVLNGGFTIRPCIAIKIVWYLKKNITMRWYRMISLGTMGGMYGSYLPWNVEKTLKIFYHFSKRNPFSFRERVNFIAPHFTMLCLSPHIIVTVPWTNNNILIPLHINIYIYIKNIREKKLQDCASNPMSWFRKYIRIVGKFPWSEI